MEFQLEILSLNTCGDHVHLIIRSNSIQDLHKKIGLLKGKTAYYFNRRVDSYNIDANSINTNNSKRSLWSKGFYSVPIKDQEQFETTKKYIEDNRVKHNLPPLSQKSQEIIERLTK